MARGRIVQFTILGDASKAIKELQKLSGQGASIGDKMRNLGSNLSRSVSLPLAALGAIAVNELMNVERVMGQTNAAIESTGGVANVTAGHIADLAGRFQNLAGVDAEVIQESQNVLLTFTKIRNEVGKGNDIFDQASKSVLNMSARLGTDLNSASIQVGKALNDPIKGVTSLGRAGVQFTEEQKEQIATLVESGDTLGAQKLILKELETQFGGSAEAAGKTFAGQLNKARFALEDAGAAILKSLLPTLKSAAEWVADLATKFSNLSPAVRRTILIVGGIALVAGPVISAIAAIGTALAFLAANPIVLVVAAVVGLTVLIVKNWDKIKEWTENIFGAVGDFLSDVWNGIVNVVGEAIAFILGLFRTLLSVWISVAGGIVTAAAKAFGWIPGIGPKIERAADDFRDFTGDILRGLDRQIAGFRRWGDTTSAEIDRLSSDFQNFTNQIGDTTTLQGAFGFVGGGVSGGGGGGGGSTTTSGGKTKPPLTQTNRTVVNIDGRTVSDTQTRRRILLNAG